MQKDFLQHINEIIEANLSNEKFGIEELSSKMGMNRMSLYRKIKSSTNKSGSQFIRELRLVKGKELLENEDITVSEVSYRVGFGSPTYFSKCFREYFGVTPGELRNREPLIELVNVPEEQRYLKKNKTNKYTDWTGRFTICSDTGFGFHCRQFKLIKTDNRR